MSKQLGPLTQKRILHRRLYLLRLVILVSAIGVIGYFFFLQPYRSVLREIPIEQGRP